MSADTALGIPYNIASYALLTDIIAQILGISSNEFIHTTGDTHIYLDHVEAMADHIRLPEFPLPKIKIDQDFIDKTVDVIYNGKKYDLDDVKLVTLIGYQSHPPLKLKMAV